MTQLLTEELVREAVDLVRLAIDDIRVNFAKRGDGHLVVGDPLVSRDITLRFLYQESFGHKKHWEHPYDDIARAKGQISHRTGQNARVVATEEPWMFAEGNTKFVGGIAYGPSKRLIVAYSGAEDYIDEMICLLVAAAIQAVCRRAYLGLPAEMDFPWEDLPVGQ